MKYKTVFVCLLNLSIVSLRILQIGVHIKVILAIFVKKIFLYV